MVAYRYPVIAKEGWLLISMAIVGAVILQLSLGLYAATPLWIIALMLCFIFRDPARIVPPKPLAIVCPVDGKVIAVKKVNDPCLNRQVVQIQIRMGWLNVFSTRSPMEGKVIRQWFGKNAFLNAHHKANNSQTQSTVIVPAAEQCARHFAQWIQSDESDDVVMSLEPNVNFLRPRCYVRGGERVGQGQRCGLIPFGAKVDVYVPSDSVMEVKVGNKVRAGSDTLATLVH